MRASLITLAFVAAALSGCGGPVNLDSNQMKTAENGALKFFANYGADFVGCSSVDSEPDDYVTCTGKDRETRRPIAASCTYKGDVGGCKAK